MHWKNIFSAHLGAEYVMKKRVENPSKNTDSSMSNFAKSEVKKSGLYNTFSCSRLREILKNEKQKSGLFPLRLREGNWIQVYIVQTWNQWTFFGGANFSKSLREGNWKGVFYSPNVESLDHFWRCQLFQKFERGKLKRGVL